MLWLANDVIMRINLCLLLIVVMGCSHLLGTTPTHWVHVEDGVEDYDRCVRDSDGRVLVEVMHATHNASGTFGVFENGAGRGDYLTREQAKRAAGDVVRSCAIK